MAKRLWTTISCMGRSEVEIQLNGFPYIILTWQVYVDGSDLILVVEHSDERKSDG